MHNLIYAYTPLSAIKTKTERRLWHNRLAHMAPNLVQQAHKYVKGIPEMKGSPLCPELDQCSTCIRSKLHKASPGKGLADATVPYQCLSIDFSFSGVVSKDKTRREDIEGLNGETSWILVKDLFSKIIHADTRTSKAPPVEWLKAFLTQYSPTTDCTKHVVLDQGGELYNSPLIRNLFKKFNYQISPTGSDASYQNPVERDHRTVA